MWNVLRDAVMIDIDRSQGNHFEGHKGENTLMFNNTQRRNIAQTETPRDSAESYSALWCEKTLQNTASTTCIWKHCIELDRNTALKAHTSKHCMDRLHLDFFEGLRLKTLKKNSIGRLHMDLFDLRVTKPKHCFDRLHVD